MYMWSLSDMHFFDSSVYLSIGMALKDSSTIFTDQFHNVLVNLMPG